jgi:hypothetical protein
LAAIWGATADANFKLANFSGSTPPNFDEVRCCFGRFFKTTDEFYFYVLGDYNKCLCRARRCHRSRTGCLQVFATYQNVKNKKFTTTLERRQQNVKRVSTKNGTRQAKLWKDAFYVSLCLPKSWEI